MNIENNYNGIQFGEKCLVWDDYEKDAREMTFVSYCEGKALPFLTAEGVFYKHAEPLPKKNTINRIEVIGPQGREHVLFGNTEYEHDVMYQDNGKTLKIFLTEVEK
jgi:hypothetical protein